MRTAAASAGGSRDAASGSTLVRATPAPVGSHFAIEGMQGLEDGELDDPDPDQGADDGGDGVAGQGPHRHPQQSVAAGDQDGSQCQGGHVDGQVVDAVGGVEGERDGEGEGEEGCAEGCPDEAAGEQLGEQDPAPMGSAR